MVEQARKEERATLESIGWSPRMVQRYPEKAFEFMVEFYGQSQEQTPRDLDITDEMVERFVRIWHAWPLDRGPDAFRTRVRGTLEAALRVPVEKGEEL